MGAPCRADPELVLTKSGAAAGGRWPRRDGRVARGRAEIYRVHVYKVQSPTKRSDRRKIYRVHVCVRCGSDLVGAVVE